MKEIAFAVIGKQSQQGKEYLVGSTNERRKIDLGERIIKVYLPDYGASMRTGEVRIVPRQQFRAAVRGEATALVENVRIGVGAVVERSQIQIPLVWRSSIHEEKGYLEGSIEFPIEVDLDTLTWIIYPEFEFPKNSPLKGDAKLILRAEKRIRERKNAA